MNPDAPFPEPIGTLQLTLWQEKGPEIHVNFIGAETGSLIQSSSPNSDLANTRTSSESKDRTSNVSTPTYSPSPSYGGKIAVAALIIALVIGAVVFMSSGKKSAPQVASACVGKECNLRSSPAKGKNVIRTIPKGGTVAIVENTGEWAKVRYANSERYIKSNLISQSMK